MTNLGNHTVYSEGKFLIYISISGDLSHSYHLVPASSQRDGYIGVGYGFMTKKDAKKWLKTAQKIGYGSSRFKRMYDKYLKTAQFKYLTYSEAKKYKVIRFAYDDVAEKYKKRLREEKK